MKQRAIKLGQSQQGVAVIMALLLTTLALTIVASLFWQQQVQVRLIENQRLQLQKQWILRGALDWASLIVREDAKYSSIDSLDEPWATPLADTRLDQYVENGKADSDLGDTQLAGQISDAQARFNLTNLSPNGVIDPAAVAQYARLLSLLNVDATLAQKTAQAMTQAAQQNVAPFIPTANNSAPKIMSEGVMHRVTGIPVIAPPVNLPIATPLSSAQTISFSQVDDLLAIPGYSPALLGKLRPVVIFLPRSAPVNINTADAMVLAALVNNLSLSEAQMLVGARKSARFNDLNAITSRLAGKHFSATSFSVTSSYFLIDGKVHMNRARLDMQALLERNGAVTKLLWIREF
ncbi:MAG: type II secretion system minor pseudopilin GspK [Gallionella sp.]